MKVLFIAPYPGLAEVVKKMDIQEDVEFDIIIANLEEGIEAAKKAERQGYEVIISRGGTATMIQSHVSIPVVHIDISGYDMLRVFTLIQGINEKVALVGFANISQGAATICNILEYNVEMVTIQSREEVRKQLDILKSRGFSVVIGDVVTVQVAQQVGLRGVLITSGREAVRDAIEEGKRVHRLFQKVNNQYYYLRETFNTIPFPMVLLNQDKEVVEKNTFFSDMEQSNQLLEQSTITRLVRNVLYSEEQQWAEIEEDNRIYEVQCFVVDKEQSIVGLIVHGSFEKENHRAIKIMDYPTHMPIIGGSEEAKRLRTSIRQYASLQDNICLIGEMGSGKQSIAEAIHFESYGQQFPIVCIDGNRLNENSGEDELDQLMLKLERMKKGTIIFKHIERLSATLQKKVMILLGNKPKEVKFITLVNGSLEESVRKIDESLYKELTQNVLHIPSLRHRKEDIGAFVDYFIAEFHAKNGNEIVGIRQDAVEYLEQYDWEGNLTQLKQVVRELSATVSPNYINLSQVVELMDQKESSGQSKIGTPVSLEGTLEEIERRIIERVLEEEGHNQTKTAKRLGINRSTLWRKLQQKH